MNRRNCISRHGNCNRPASNFRKTRHSRQSHIVGYNTINIPANRLCAIGIQFTEVSGLTEIPVKDVFTVDQPKGAAGLSDPADQIWLWDTTAMNWKRYFYSSGRGSKVTGWCNEEDNTKITTDTMKNGDGCFFRRSSTAQGNLTISGALKPTSANPVILTANRLHFVCNPWPVEINIADFATLIDAPKGAAGLSDPADQIWLWDTTAMNWKRYFYSSGRGSKITGWCNEEDNTKVTEDKIGVGQGFFLRRSSTANGNLTFVKPTF